MRVTTFGDRLALSLRSAAVTIVAVLVTLGVALLLDPEPGPAIFGMLLAISLSRSQLERDARGRLEAGLVLPAVALVGAATGALLAAAPWAGAAVFTAAVAASVYLRRFGELPRRIGSLLALPFTALLVAPVHSERLGPGLSLVVTLVIGIVAWAAVTLLQLGALRVGLLPARAPSAPGAAARRGRGADARGTPGRRVDATSRLALQMLVAVGASFVIGFLVFPDRWSWIVLTALIVTIGNAGRADVTHKAVQRVIGAGVGSILALLPLLLPHPPVWLGLTLVLVALFAGLVLRPFGYVWWTLTVTVALALVQSFSTGRFSLLERWEEIVLGAMIALVVAWLLLPVRSESTVRRRLADALAATSDWLAAATAAPAAGADTDSAEPADAASGQADAPGRTDAASSASASPAPSVQALRARVRAAVAGIDRVAPPFDAAKRWLPRAWRPRACGWLDSGRAAIALLLDHPRAAIRRPLGDARRALRTPDELQSALDALVAAASDRP